MLMVRLLHRMCRRNAGPLQPLAPAVERVEFIGQDSRLRIVGRPQQFQGQIRGFHAAGHVEARSQVEPHGRGGDRTFGAPGHQLQLPQSRSFRLLHDLQAALDQHPILVHHRHHVSHRTQGDQIKESV